MWDSQLQFSNYSENNLKMAVLQLVHVILIIAELRLLMQLGRTLKRHRLCRTRVVTTWLVLVAYGAGSVLLQLVWKNQFYFSDLLNAVFPITRNIFPLATAYIIAMATFPRVNELSEVNRRFLGKVLVGMFLLQKNQVIGEHQILINIGRESRDFSHGMDRLLLTSFRAFFYFIVLLIIDILLNDLLAHIP
ncbi:hypothetical protein [Limosilactobacillus fermentum]|uniref:hypothetical protein n=1 Tax=Limosilactobacillus fermentum TaxID=1613 RepID=UPI00223BF967|nr:hypothetical protein [Limosilactobacillus fermentum]